MNWQYLMIHHSLTEDGRTVSWDAIRRYHIQNKKWIDIGYHFGVEKVDSDYEVFVGRPLNKPGAHCYQQSMNYKSIGICCVGNYDESLPDTIMWTILGYRLVIPLMEIFNIPIENIKFHREYAKYKSCPGVRFNKNEFIKLINDLR